MSKNINKLEVPVGRKALRIVQLHLLNIDRSYQRGITPRYKNIVKTFDPDALGIPLVGQREDGTLWVVDGQQRCEALKELGKREVRAEVFVSKGPEHEAQVFKLVNQNRTRLRSEELFNALLTAGDEDCWKVKEALDKYKFIVPMHGAIVKPDDKANSVRCVNILVKIYQSKGQECLDFILDTIKESWPDDPLRVKNEIVEGLWMFYSNMKGSIDKERLLKNLNTVTPSKLIYSAQLGIGSKASNMAEAIAKVYRKKLKRD